MTDLTGKCPVVIQQDLIWNDMDAFQHINNTRYFRFFEDARIAYFEKIAILEHMEAHSIGPILASTRCDFRVPLTYPGRIQIAAWVDAIEKKHFTMKYRVYSEDLDKVAAEGDAVIVTYDYSSGKSCEIPEQIVSKIKELEACTTIA
jgi:acyl-CoA thioester hydrolase